MFPLSAADGVDDTPSQSNTAAETAPHSGLSQSNLEEVMTYLRKARLRAEKVRDNSPAGSYLESVLTRTMAGLDRELAQLSYLLAKRDHPAPQATKMRPAI
ncbi:hypothetical protein E1178_05950 [Roseibium hamelinense]|nr:hypothetical protein [Roseibium hamelinense]